MNLTKTTTADNQQRRGTILLCVMVCLALVITFVTSTTKAALRARRQAVLQLQYAQVELLLEAGIQRATRLMRTDSEFEGETWEPSIESLPQGSAGSVEIRVTRFEDDDPFVLVTARLTENASPAVQLSYQFTANKL